MIKQAILVLLAIPATGCVMTANTVLELPEEFSASRASQTRFYDNVAEAKLNSASAAALQDLGFNINKSEPGIGLIMASKNRSAVEPGQVVLSIALMLLLGANVPWDEMQLIRASVTTRPLTETSANGCSLRITMQRTVWNTDNQMSRQETINDPEIFEKFFAHLSKSLFLEEEAI